MEFISRFIWLIDKNTQVFMAGRLKKYGIGNGQLPMLMLLYNYKGILNQKEISRLLNIDKAATARAAGKLLREGFIERTTDKSDRRMQRVVLTGKALKLKTDLFKIVEDWQKILLSGFDDNEKASAFKLLEKIKNNSRDYNK
jgi:DNA-binding MarR family transcriptional regulator